MSIAFTLMTLQALLGAAANLWHHEITERLPAKRSAASELALHAARELLYGLVFVGLAWFRWQGLWVALVAAALLCEVVVTLADFVVENKSRNLRAAERILHTILALNYGACLAFLASLLIGWSRMPTALTMASHSFSWLFSLFGLGLFFWSGRNAVAVLMLRRPPQWVREPFAAGSSPETRTILLSGATGFIGGHLVHRLVRRGDRVTVLTRRPDVALDRFGPHVRVITDPEQIGSATRIDAIINLAGAPILGLRWTQKRRTQLIDSRIQTTRALTLLMSRLEHPVRIFISASAVGFYGIGGDEILDEAARPSEIFQSQLCQDWESEARAAARLGARLVRMRIGLVLGKDGGALPRLARPMRLCLGAVLGTGRQWMSWIHIEDLLRVFEFAIDTPRLSGAVNAVAPTPLMHREFQSTLGRVLHRPLWLHIPAAPLRVMLGEMAQLLVDGQRVVPNRLNGLGFEFRYPSIKSAMDQLLGAPSPQAALTEVFFNGECPVCKTHMSRYAVLCAGPQPALRFRDALQGPDQLAACGLRREHLERRLYVRQADGRMVSGMPALLRLWATMPEHRRLARLLAMPVVRDICSVLYDHVVAPGLSMWARHRCDPNTMRSRKV